MLTNSNYLIANIKITTSYTCEMKMNLQTVHTHIPKNITGNSKGKVVSDRNIKFEKITDIWKDGRTKENRRW